MAKKYKGKYKGPDAFKGNAADISAWKKAGSPKNIDEFLRTRNASKPAFKGKYPGPDEFKGDESAITGWKAAGKSKEYTQAWGLGESKYAPALKEIEMTGKSNTDLYTSASSQRKGAIDREIGSINAAGATSRKTIGDLGAGNQTMYQQAVAQSQSNTKELLSKVDQNNSNMLSSLQAEIKARGGSPEDYAYLSPLTRQTAQTGETLAAVGEMNRGALQAQQGMDQTRTTSLQAMADMMATTGASQARGKAQTDMNELYNKWLARKGELDTANAKTKLEKGDYVNQTYLTLKEKKEAEKAAAAQAKLQAQIASGNLEYKNTKLKVDTQYKYDALAQKQAQKDIENKLKERGFTHKRAVDLAKLAVQQSSDKRNWEKFNWNKLNPKASQQINLADLLAAGN